MLGKGHWAVLVAECLDHVHLLLYEHHQAFSALLVGEEPEGEVVYARELGREDREALDIDVPAGEYAGNGGQKPDLVLRIHGDDIQSIFLIHRTIRLCLTRFRLWPFLPEP